jgi:adenylate kinase
MQTKTFVFFGQAGSGKGTQIELLTEYLKTKDKTDIVYAGTGDGFRKLVDSGSYAGDLVREIMMRGELVPDFLTNAVFGNILTSSLTPDKHLITDGYPRSAFQSEVFEQMMTFFKREEVKIINIELSEEEAVKRNLLRGRADDTEEGLRKRLNEYKNNVIPAMNYFLEKSGYEILKINGDQSIEEVHKDILKALGFN